jgi:cephalosporin hydroxylase
MMAPERARSRVFRISTPEGHTEVDIYTPEGYRLLAELWLKSAWQHRISYEVTWLGIPIIQLPEDIVMMQELIYKIRPDVIVETGVAHGGSAIFYASMLELLGKGRVLSVDNEIRKYNRLAICSHPMSKRITLIEGSSTNEGTLKQLRALIGPQDAALVALDSNHAYAHVREELEKYSALVTPGSYIVVFDGVMKLLDDAPGGAPHWASDNPYAATQDFLATHPEFESDPYYNRLLVSYCPGGFLRRKAG